MRSTSRTIGGSPVLRLTVVTSLSRSTSDTQARPKFCSISVILFQASVPGAAEVLPRIPGVAARSEKSIQSWRLSRFVQHASATAGPIASPVCTSHSPSAIGTP